MMTTLLSSETSQAIVLGQSLEVANSYLRDFATSPEFQAKMQLAFGNHKIWDKADLINFPTIEIRPASEINNAKGAFAAATNTIYLSQELVDENSGNVNAIASVLLEEYGHYIDAEMNAIDSPGDEGDIFANLVVGQGLSESELLALWGEDDSAIVVLGGEEVAIEQANVSWLGGSGDWYNPRKWSGGKVPNSSDNVTVEAIGERVKINFSKGNPNIQDLFLAAKGGGSLSLNGLTTLGNDTDILAEGNKSIVKLPNLKTFSGKDVSSPSYIMVKDGGEVEAKKLTALKEVDLYATNSQLNLSGIKTFSGTTDTVIEAKDGGKLTLNATRISGDVDVTSNGKGSVVQLPRLTAFDGTDSSSPSFIWAVNQGTVKAQKLASLKEVDLYATNSQLNLSGIKTFSGTTDTVIEAKDGGKLTLNATRISGDVDVTSNGKGSVVQLPRLTAFDSIVKTNGGQVKKIAPKKSPVEDNKTIEGTAKDDLINGTKKDDIINGQAGDDTLNGNNGNDKLLGGKGWDFIQGNEGNDTLLGNENSDVLVGGNGRDILTGGSASDVFFLTPETSKKTLADRITDFDKATDFIVLGNNLTADQVKLEKIKEGTLITVKKTGKILGIVEKVQPSDLEYSLISGNVPSDLGKLVTFGEPISKSLANGNVKLELKGSDGGKFTTTLSEEKGIEQIRYLAGRSSNIKGSFTLDIKNNGSQINLQIDGNKNEWEIKRKKNEEIDVSLNGEVFMTLPPIPKNDDGGEDTDCCDIDLLDPCKIFKQICATVEQINSVLSWIPPLPSLAPLTAVQMGLEFTEYACLLVLGDDQKLNDLIASKTLSFFSEKAGDAMLNFYRKQTRFNKFLDDNEIFINPKVFDALERTKKQNDDIFKQFLGNGVNSVPFFSDLSSSIVRFIDDKLPNNNRNNVMKNLRKHLGIDWCDEDVETKEANIEIAGPKEVDHHKYALFTVSYDNPEKEAKGVEIMGFDGLTSGVKFVPIPKAKLEEGKFQFKAYNEDFFGSVDAEKVFSANLVSEPSVFSYTIAASDPDATVNFLGAGGWSGLNAQAIPATDKNGDFWVKWL